MKLLLDAGALVDGPKDVLYTALRGILTKNGSLECAQVLIDRGADVLQMKEMCPLWVRCAVKNCDLERVNFLLEHISQDFDRDPETLRIAIRFGHQEIVLRLLEIGWKVRTASLETAVYALKGTHICRVDNMNKDMESEEILELVLQRLSMSCDSEEMRLLTTKHLTEAFSGKSLKAVRLLLSYGADPSLPVGYQKITPLSSLFQPLLGSPNTWSLPDRLSTLNMLVEVLQSCCDINLIHPGFGFDFLKGNKLPLYPKICHLRYQHEGEKVCERCPFTTPISVQHHFSVHQRPPS